MPRPMRRRNVDSEFEFTYFKPNGVPMSELEEVILNSDELEALRLSNLEEMYQEDAASKMGVSRQTFGNIIKAAQKKITDALVNGKAISIGGGEVNFRCRRTGRGAGRGRGAGMQGEGFQGNGRGEGCGRGAGRGLGRGRCRRNP